MVVTARLSRGDNPNFRPAFRHNTQNHAHTCSDTHAFINPRLHPYMVEDVEWVKSVILCERIRGERGTILGNSLLTD